MSPMIAALAGLPAGLSGARLVKVYAPAISRFEFIVWVLAMAGAWAWAAWVVPGEAMLVVSLVLAWTLLCLAAIDIACFRLPDAFTLPLAVAGVAASFLLPGRPVLEHLAGAVAGYLVLAGVAWAYRRWRGREGMGMGDAKLLGAAGAWLGPALLPQTVLFACLLAFCWIGVKLAMGERDLGRMRIAFGAPLCLSIWIVWLYAPVPG